MDYKNSTENRIDGEILSSEDEKIRLMLGDLKRIDAPRDFDFRVKARIAGAALLDHQPRFFPVLRYVLPLGLIILISAALVFNSVYFGETQNAVPIVAEKNNIQKENPADKLLSAEQSGGEDIAGKIENEFSGAGVSNSKIVQAQNGKTSEPEFKTVAVKSTRRANLKVFRKANYNDNSGGSLLSASTSTTPKQIINRAGIVSGKTIRNLPNNGENVQSLTAKDILFQLGAEAVFINESWTVKSVRQNSPAEHSGVKTGDAIEAIDGEKLNDKPLKNRTIEGKKLTVARGAEKIEITLILKSN